MGLTRTEQDVIDSLRARIADALERQVTGSRVVCEASRALGYSLSFVFTRHGDGGQCERLFAKIRRAAKFGHYDSPDDGGRAARLGRQEHEALVRADAWFRLNAPDMGVVEPVLYLEDVNALVIRAARGKALDTLLAERHPLAMPAIARCARWLRAFHTQVNDPLTVPWRSSTFVKRYDKVLVQLEASGAAAHVEDLRRRVATHAARFDGVPHVQTLVHGDLKLRHVWASPEHLDVLDLGNVHRASIVEDLAAFVVELELLDLGSRGRVTRSTQDMATVFLDSYGALDAAPLMAIELVLVRAKKWARRRRRFSGSARADRVQGTLRRVGLQGIVQQRYVDPWFKERIDAELQWLEGQTPDGVPRRPFTARYDEAIRRDFATVADEGSPS